VFFDRFWHLIANKIRIKDRENIFLHKMSKWICKTNKLVFAVSSDLDSGGFRSLFRYVCECKVNPCQNRPLHVFIIFIQLMALIISSLLEARCLFHQHFTGAFFVQKCLSLFTFRQKKHFRPKNARVKCWWHWLQGSISPLFNEQLTQSESFKAQIFCT